MNKPAVLKLSLAIILILGTVNFSHAQDTIGAAHKKTVKPVVTAPIGVKPPQTPKPYPGKPYTAKPVTPFHTPITQVTQAIQPTPTPVSTDKSLEGQYQYIITKIYHYQQPMVAAFWKNVKDTLTTERARLKTDQGTLTAQTKKLKELQSDVNQKDQTLAASNQQLDSISLFGLLLSKTTYNLLMWGIVLAIGIVLIIVIFTTASSRSEGRYRTKLYDELAEEFQTYKAKANDKEKKLARELQTERNKVEELKGRG